jgi:adenylate cyclase
MLKNYLGAMADIITDHQGAIDEFQGDGIFALFGAPTTEPDDAARAAACALAMQAAVEGVNEQNRAEGLPDVELGIALNTGDVVVGNVGSTTRTKYGVVGSQVNLTARIESATVGGQVLISDSTVAELDGAAITGRRIELRAKGFREPIGAHELIGLKDRPELQLRSYDDAMAPLEHALPVRFVVIAGKRTDGEALSGALRSLGERSAVLEAETELETFSHLQLRLLDDTMKELPGELYGKVVPAAADLPARSCEVRFTSIAPEVQNVLARSRSHA